MSAYPLIANFPHLSRLWLLTALLASLSACGGGGGGGDSPVSAAPVAPVPAPVAPIAPAPGPIPVPTPVPVPPPIAVPAPLPGPVPLPQPVVLTAQQFQGLWAAASANPASNASALVIAETASTAQVWMLAQDLSAVSKLNLTTGAATSVVGTTFTFATAASGSQASQSRVSVGASGAGLSLATTPAPTLAFDGQGLAGRVGDNKLPFTRSDALTAPTLQADAAGAWRASFGQNAAAINWSVSPQGVITGSSTTGCVWSGGILAQSNATVYRLSITESCTGSSAALAGIATLNPAKTQLTVVATTANDTAAVVLLMARP